MGYKMKPVKGVLKRFKFTKTGKVKQHHAYTSHLLSGRSGDKKRRLGRPSIMSETLGRSMRNLVGLNARNPNRTRHLKAVAAKAAEKAAAAPATAAA